MVSQQLKLKIEEFAESLKSGNPLFVKTQEGKINHSQITHYLNNIHFLIQHTPVHLRLAHRRSIELGLNDLAAFFEKKIIEEDGHDEWSKSDLRTFDKSVAKSLCLSMVDLVRYLEDTIAKDPRRYITYILLAEYLTVICAPEWLQSLDKNCGIRPQQMTVVGNHVTLDREHVLDDLEEIDQMARNVDASEMISTLTGAMARVDQFYREVASS